MARRKGDGLGTLVMIIFLLFFILLSIGLGVSTYLGFAQDDSKDKKIKDLTAQKAEADQKVEWYKFQADTYRYGMGYEQNIDNKEYVTQRTKFDAGGLPATASPDKEDVKTLITKTLDEKLHWNKAGNKWDKNFTQLLDDEKKAKQAAIDQSDADKARQAKEKERADKLDELLTRTKDEHEKAYQDLQRKAATDLAQLIAANEQLEKDKKELSELIAAKASANEQDKQMIAKLFKEKDDAIKALRNRVAKADERIAVLNKQVSGDVPTDYRLDWKVMSTDSRGETAYINLGSADHVQSRLTFRVHGIGVDGRPMPKDKATIEVVNVLGDHLAQARINYDTSSRDNPRHDPGHNPVIKGDVLINPGWHPNQKTHIAIAGIVDMTGSGHDETEQLVRSLERFNVVVDAYIDMRKDFTIKGPGISVQTDYLIIGDKPAAVLESGGREKEIIAKIGKAMEDMQKEAKENGVRVRTLRQYLEEIGYTIPGNPEQRPPTLNLNKGEPGALPPPVPKDPMKDDKPAPMP